jgi:hypothetical protein
MKIAVLLCVILLSFRIYSQTENDKTNSELKDIKLEVSCGQCNFGLNAEGCSLAIRFEGQAYFVDGKSIDELGDAHAHDGFCSTIREAIVSGVFENNRFQLTQIELIPFEK